MSSESSPHQSRYKLLVVDDNDVNRRILSGRLEKQGYAVECAADGQQAIELVRTSSRGYDLILLDVIMPKMNGFAVLEALKSDETLRHIPVIMISAVDEIESIVRCIQLGAEDYLPKPFNPTLLRARVGASLEKKRLRDQEQAYLSQIEAEQQRSERLLLNILPKPIADRLKQEETIIADSFSEVSVLFADIVDFTTLTYQASPGELIRVLNEIFTEFDKLTETFGLEKIKTIGDAYMVVGGLPIPKPGHLASVADMALAMQQTARSFRGYQGREFAIRVGVHVGPVVAGVIGTKKFIYDLWGDTVNLASRMESHGLPRMIQVSRQVRERLEADYQFEARGPTFLKGWGEMETYFLTGKR